MNNSTSELVVKNKNKTSLISNEFTKNCHLTGETSLGCLFLHLHSTLYFLKYFVLQIFKIKSKMTKTPSQYLSILTKSFFI